MAFSYFGVKEDVVAEITMCDTQWFCGGVDGWSRCFDGDVVVALDA